MCLHGSAVRAELMAWSMGRLAHGQALASSVRPALGRSQLAGSASSGSNASSAAPSSGASTPSDAGTTRTSSRGAGRARRSSSPAIVRATNGWIRPNSPPRTTSRGIEDVHQAGQAEAEPVADVVEGAERGRRAGLGLAQHGRDLEATAAGRMAGPQEQGSLADLGLPAADRPTATGRAVRVDGDVARPRRRSRRRR